MKKIFLLTVLIGLPGWLLAQDAVYNGPESVRYSYNDLRMKDTGSVVQVEDASAADLFSRGKLLISEMFKSAKAVTQLTDEHTHTLIAKGYFPVSTFPALQGPAFGSPMVAFTFMLQAKDGRYRYIIKDMKYELGTARSDPLKAGKPRGFGKRRWGQMIAESKMTVKEMTTLIQKYMSGNAGFSSNW